MKNESSGTSTAQSPETETENVTATRTNQNLVVGLVLGAIVIILSLLVLQITDKGLGGKKSEIEKLREQLDAKRQSMESLEGTSQPTRESPAQLATRLSTESSQLATMVNQLQASVETLRGELQISQTTVRSLSSQLANATSTTIDNDDLRRKLEVALSRAAGAETQLRNMQQESLGSPTREQMEALLEERDQLRAMISRLKSAEPSEASE